MIASYHGKDIDMLKPGCTSANLANICLQKPTDAQIYPFTERENDFFEKIREDIVDCPSFVFTRTAVVDEPFIRKSANICKSIVGIDASQLYPCSMCQTMPTGVYTSWDVDSETGRFTPRKTRPAALKIWSCPNSNEQQQNVKLNASLQQVDMKKLTASVLMGFCSHCNILFAVMGCFYHFRLCQELPFSLTEEDFQPGNLVAKKESPMHWYDTIYKRKAWRILKCGRANGGDCTMQPKLLNNISENTFIISVHLQLSNF